MAPEPPPHQTHPTAPLAIESVAFATGSGRLVRRATTVLFDPTGQNTKLTSAFDDAASDEEAVGQVLASLLEADLGLEPFAIVRWSGPLELIVFGDVAIETSVPSAPLISGASSQTWVTHLIEAERLDVSPLQVSCGQPAEPGTNLRLGIAACDGFRLDLTTAPIDQPVEPEQGTQPEPSAQPVPAVPATPPVADLVDERPAPPPPPPPPPAAPSEPVAPAVAPADPIAETIVTQVPVSERATFDGLDHSADQSGGAAEDAADLPPGVDAIWTADDSAPDEAAGAPLLDDDADPFVVDDPTPKFASPPPGPLLEFDPSDPPEAPAAEPAEAPAPAPPADVSAVESASDASGAAGETDPLVEPTDLSVEGIEWTDAVFGLLVFDRFPNSPVDGPVVLGRRPEASGDQTPIVVDHPEVSRNHAALHVDGWSVSLVDLDSRNGTWVQPPTGEGVRRLDPDERVVLMPGTIVHLGSAEVAFTWQPT